MNILHNFAFSIAVALAGSSAAYAIEIDEYPDIQAIAARLVADGTYQQEELEALFAQVDFNPQVIKAFQRPAESLSWSRYRNLFITDSVIENGVEFWNRHQQDLSRASDQYGMPEEIIVAITGVETRFGTSKGNNHVINSLATLSVYYERRKAFFQAELEEFLRLAKSERLDPLVIKGSYAGAMGIPQFIASSYQAYAVDFNGDGIRDLLNSHTDAIGSVANYFRRHNWVSGQPIAARLQKVVPGKVKQFGQSGKSTTHTMSAIQAAGFAAAVSYPGQLGADIIQLDGANGKEYWLVFDNFYVIKRYNNSNLYAMAVTQLAEAIRQKRQG